MEEIAEIKKRAQEPVRQYNDIAGVLVGDHLSIHITRLFVALRLSPTVATLAMLVFGVLGAFLIPFDGLYSVAGFALVFLYYICDCVDGEVARFNKVERIAWGFHDFLFHLYVKTSFFLALGALAVGVTGSPWVFLFGVSGLIATLFTKFLDDVAISVTCRQILSRPPAEHAVQLSELTEGLDLDETDEPELGPAGYRSPLGFARAMVTNFDLASVLFLAAALIDLVLPELALFGLTWNLKALLVVFYGVVLPLDFTDRVQTAIRKGEFRERARALCRDAHHFRVRD